MKLSLAFLLLFFNTLAYASPHDDEVLQKIADVNELKTCPLPPKKTLFSGFSCSELLSTQAPAWVKANDLNHFFSKSGNWAPVCALSRLDAYQSKHPKSTRPSQVSWLVSEQKSYDTCGTDQNRNSKKHKIGSAATAINENGTVGVRPLNGDERTEVMKSVREVQARSASRCCAEDKVCLNLMNAVTVKFCEFSKDKTVADECLDAGTFFQAYDYPGLRSQSAAQIKGKITFKAGIFTIDPYQREAKDEYYHEFGHACSWTKRMLAINAGSEAELSEYKGHAVDQEDCSITPDTGKTYENLVKGAGFSTESNQCLVKYAGLAEQARFKKGACEGGCQRDQYEEALADLFAYAAAADAEYIPAFIPVGICDSFREGDKMLATDILGCALKTPEFRTRVEEITQCAK